MTPSMKKICIYSQAAGLGKMILNQLHKFDLPESERELIAWNSNLIILAGEKAIDKCNVTIDRNKMKNAEKKIDQICKDGKEFNIVETLSFTLLGLNDLSHYCKDKKVIKQLEEIALNFTTVYDPNLEDEASHATALEKYKRWVA